jgi:hypothetical protein
MVREVAQLARGEVGRIRVRDRHTFVEVPEDKVDATIEKLRGHLAYQKALAPERAKGNRS